MKQNQSFFKETGTKRDRLALLRGLAITTALALAGCASAPARPEAAAAVSAAAGGVSMDEAIAQAAERMEARLPAESKVALISVSSPSQTFSNYVLDRLEAVLVNNGQLVVVDRANLDKVREEQGFQMSGEVSDESAKAIGKLIGADAIVTGSLVSLGSLYQLMLKAINMESAVVAASHQADIAADERVRALLGQTGVAAALTSGAGVPANPASTQIAPPVEKPFAPGDLGGAWTGLLSYTAGGQSYRDTYTLRLYADGSCWVSVTAAGAAQAAWGIWSAENGEFRLDCAFRNPAIARLDSLHWISLYALQNDKRALRVNIRPAPDYSGVAALTLYKD